MLGVSRHIGKIFHHRIVWNGDGTFKNSYDQEFRASKSTYMSWYATEPKPSRPVGRASSVGLDQKTCSHDSSNVAYESVHLPVNNRFQILQNSSENTYEIHQNVPTALDEVVMASAITTSQIPHKKQPHDTNNIE